MSWRWKKDEKKPKFGAEMKGKENEAAAATAAARELFNLLYEVEFSGELKHFSRRKKC